jgi:hypothetical protein
MAERIDKQILEVQYKVTGTEVSEEKLNSLVASSNQVTKSTLERVAADKKVEQAANQLNKSIDTQTKKNTELSQSIQQTGKAMAQVAATNNLKKTFQDSAKGAFDLNKELGKFKEAARAATSVDELSSAIDNFTATLPADIKNDVIKLIQKEAEQLERTLVKPTSRLRELKRLINTETDPVLLKKYQIEAGKLQDKLGDTNDLVRALASDTFFSDTLVEGAQTAVGAFSAFQGVVALTTEDQEEFAKAAAKAQGALALLQGTQQILTNLKKDDNIVTRLQIVGQKLYAAVVGESTGAMKGFKLALAATGIGLAVIGIAALVANWDKLKEAITGTSEAQRQNAKFAKEASDAVTQEAVAIGIAKAQLQDSNTTQEQRIQIIRDLQQQYPAYLGNLDAETASYEDIETALNKVNQALFIKSSIQVRESAIAELQKQLFDLEQQIPATEEKIKSFQNAFARDAEERGLNDFFAQAAQTELSSIQGRSQETKAAIDALINDIVKKSQELGALGGDPTAPINSIINSTEKATKEVENILEGSIAALEKKVSDLRKQVTSGVKIGTDEFNKVRDEYLIASKQLAEASQSLEDQAAEGSLRVLEAQASELRKIISEISAGPERDALIQQVIDAENAVIELRDQLFPKELAQQEKQNFDLLNEEERHQLAIQSIDGDSEEARLMTSLSFAKERLKILQESGNATELELIQQGNNIDELEAQLSKARIDRAKAEQKALIDARIAGAQQVLTSASNLANQLLQIEINRIAQQQQIQERRVSEAQKLAEKGNVAFLKAEQDRLDQLTAKRERYVRRQQTLARLELIANTIVLVSKAAAQTGVAAAAGIAAALIALAAGLASGIAASNATASGSFYKGGFSDEGGYTGDGNPRSESKKLGKKPYTYHKREHIMPANVVGIGNNASWLREIMVRRLSISDLIGERSPTVVMPQVPQVKDEHNYIFNLNSRGIVSITEEHRKNTERLSSRT